MHTICGASDTSCPACQSSILAGLRRFLVDRRSVLSTSIYVNRLSIHSRLFLGVRSQTLAKALNISRNDSTPAF